VNALSSSSRLAEEDLVEEPPFLVVAERVAVLRFAVLFVDFDVAICDTVF
jgi:hypothetical protein